MKTPLHRRLPVAFALVAALLLAPVASVRAQELTAAVRPQIDALQAEKAARTPAQRKIDSQLIFTIRKQRGEKLGAGLEALERGVKVAADGFELLDIDADVTPALIADLTARGATIVAAVPRFHAIRARVPLASVEAVATRADVRWVRKAVAAHTNVGSITSQGDFTHSANLARTQFGVTGRGVKVGVISDSVDSLTTSQGTLDLGPVTVLPGQSGLGIGGAGEGTAMLEIVHDLAPDAELFFATAFLSEAQFAQNILDLRTAGCDIIADDVGYFDESPFQEGAVAQAVNEIVASGGLYFTAAGNEGNEKKGTSGTWEGDFADGGPTGPLIGKAGRLHSFGATTYNTLTTNGAGANLFWADPAGASTNDYDLYVLDATGTTILAASTNIQNGHQDPYEFAATSAGARIVIVKAPGAQPRFLHLGTLRGVLSVSTSGAIVGHPAASGALAAAATSALNSSPNPFPGGAANPVETFSTDGNRRVFFEPDGTPITPGNFTATGGLLRLKPDLTAADGVSCTVPGFTPFYGTSAAAPHAAAIAALVWSRNRNLTPQQVRAAVLGSATEIEGAGTDRDSGVGIVNALGAVQSVPGGAIVSSTGPVPAGESYAPANSVFDPGETITVNLPLTNTGAAAPGNLVATLLNTSGVTGASAPQSYGALAPAASASQSFTFVVNAAAGSSATLNFQLADGATYLGTVTATFPVGTLGAEQSFVHAAATTIPTSGVATPYPSTVSVAGVTGPVGRVRVTLTNFSHTYPSDVDVLLVSPSGRKMLLMSNAGGSTAVTNRTLTFDDAALASLGATLTTGTFKPTPNGREGITFTTPAPVAPYGTTLGSFAGDAANGTWSLYVQDRLTPDGGSIASWTLKITPVSALNSGPNADLAVALTQSAANVAQGEAVTYTATVFNYGAAAASGVVLSDTLPAALAFAGGSSTLGTVANVGNAFTATIGTLGSGQSATVTIGAAAVSVGPATNTVSVALSGLDNNVHNKSASANLTIGQPNLVPVPVVVSTVAGSGIEAATIAPGDPVFVDLACSNAGNSAARAFFVDELYVDGVLHRTFEQQLPLAAGDADRQPAIALGTFGPGTHTVLFKTDTLGAVPESSEADNDAVRTFAVQGPNLAPFKLPGASDKIVVSKVAGTVTDSPAINANDPVYVDFGIVNSGALVTGIATQVVLYVDGAPVSLTPVSAALAGGATTGQSDYALGTLAAGVHTLRLVVDAGGELAETDETDNEVVKTFVINGLPTIGGIAPQTIVEDAATAALPFAVGDPETAPGDLTVAIASSDKSVIPTDGVVLGGSGANRTVTVTPAAHRSGSSTITLTVSDGSGGSTATTFLVTVLSVNDAPGFTAGPDVTVLEDAGPQTMNAWATALDRGGPEESAQTLSFTADATNADIFATPPAISATGVLTFTPAAGASGESTVTVQLHDDGGTDNGGVDASASISFKVTILAVNDAPGFTAGPDIAVSEDAGAQTFTAWATAISPGGAEEGGQTVTFTAQATDPTLFADAPAIDSAGTLTFTPAAGKNGASTVSVQAHDGGGTANGGANASAVQTFRISITTYAGKLGTYTGLALPVIGATPGAEKTGLLKVTVARLGKVTGKLTLGRISWPIAGAVDRAGVVTFGRLKTPTFTLPRKNLSPLQLVLQLDVAGDSDKLTGSVTDGVDSFAALDADRALYTSRRPVVAPFLDPTPLVGKYTLAFLALPELNGGLDADHYPQGDGVGTLAVDKKGNAKITATLPDGTKIGCANPLSKQNFWPLFATTNRGAGSIVGWVEFRHVSGDGDFDAPAVSWFKPAGAAVYPQGWTGGIQTHLVGSLYAPVRGVAILPGLGAADANGNVAFTLDGGGLVAPGLTKALRIGDDNKVAIVASAPDALTLRLTAGTGLFSGSFAPPGSSAKVKIKGVILRERSAGFGFFGGDDAVGSVTLEPNDNP